MNLEQAIDKWIKFMYENLNPRRSQNGWYKISGERICSECPRHKNRALYVWISKESRPFLKCFRASCTIRRYMTKQDFQDFGFEDDIAINIMIHAKANNGGSRSWELKTKPVIVKDKSLSLQQHKYLNKRLGIKITPSDIEFYRIVPNFVECIKETLDNDDVELMNKFNSLGLLENKQSVTFATRDYRMFMYRGIFNNVKVKYALEKDYGYSLYKGNPFNTTNLVLTEGVFDIINIYNNFYKSINSLYVATLGVIDISTINYWYRQHVETIKNIVIFADADVKINDKYYYKESYYNNLLKQIDNKIGLENLDSVILYYNTKSKDFGDMQLEIASKKVILYKRKF